MEAAILVVLNEKVFTAPDGDLVRACTSDGGRKLSVQILRVFLLEGCGCGDYVSGESEKGPPGSSLTAADGLLVVVYHITISQRKLSPTFPGRQWI